MAKYWVFISYANEDADFARRIKTKLERLRIGVKLRGFCKTPPGVETRQRVFLDKDDIVKDGKDLPDVIRQEIAQAEKLAVLCSPHAASTSSHVNLEVQEFIRLGGWKHIHPVIIGGRPSDVAGSQDCFPAALRMSHDDDGRPIGPYNPLCPDFRNDPRISNAKEWANLLSGLLGIDRQFFFDVLKRRKRTQRLSAAAGMIAALGVAFGGYFYVEHLARAERIAKRMAAIAYANSIEAARPLDAMKLVLEVWPSISEELPENFDVGLDVLSRAVRLPFERAVIGGQGTPFSKVELSPDASVALTLTPSSGQATLWNVKTGDAIFRIGSREAPATLAGFSPDSLHILTAEQGQLRLRDARTGHEIRRFPVNSDQLWEFAFSPDGSKILSDSGDNTLQVWATETGEELARLELPDLKPFASYFSGETPIVLTTNGEHAIRCWDVTASKEIPIENCPIVPGQRLSVVDNVPVYLDLPANGTFATAAEAKAAFDRQLVLVDARTGQDLRVFPVKDDAIVTARFSPDGSQFVTASMEKYVRLWKTSTGEQMGSIRHDERVIDAKFSPDGSQIVSVSADDTARLWNIGSDEQPAILRGHIADVEDAVFTSDGRRLVTLSMDSTARIWDTGKELKRFDAKEAFPLDADISPDGAYIATAHSDHSVRLWSVDTGHEIKSFIGHLDMVTGVKYSPDGKSLLTTSDDGTTRLWDIDASTERKNFATNGSFGAVFSPDGKSILSAKERHVILLSDLEGNEIRRYQIDKGTGDNVTFSPDGKRFMSVSAGDSLQVWDIATGKPVWSSPEEVEGWSAAFASDSSHVVFDDGMREIRLVDIDSNQEIQRFRAETGSINSLAFSPDHSRLLAATNHAVQLWDIATGMEILRIEIPAGLDNAVFSPAGTEVLTASSGSTTRLWDISSVAKTGNLFQIACSRVRFRSHIDEHLAKIFVPFGTYEPAPPKPDRILPNFMTIATPVTNCTDFSSAPSSR